MLLGGGVYGVPAVVSTAGLWGGALTQREISSHSPEDLKSLEALDPLFNHVTILAHSAQPPSEPSRF